VHSEVLVEIPVYRAVAAEIAARIRSGELPPGAAVPSTRQLMARHGIAMATATKVLATLRDQGLVQTRPGSGTVVAGGRPVVAAPDRDRVVRTAVAVADAEGLSALSVRRLAGELGIPTMSVYRYVADKEELLLLMMDTTMAGYPPPGLTREKDGWRACVEALARLQWLMYRQHNWLAQAVSFTRPLLAPHAMAHTEWTMRALDGFGLEPHVQFQAAVMVANYVRGTAVNLEEEAQAVQETGLTDEQWMQTQQDRFAAVLATGKLPMMARFIDAGNHEFDLDVLLELGLRTLLDGLQTLLSGSDRADVASGDVGSDVR
jgi:DNA-binding transcriptional regulator YhcF (GntR family)